MPKRKSAIIIQRIYAEPSNRQAAQKVAGFLARVAREQLLHQHANRKPASSTLSNIKAGS